MSYEKEIELDWIDILLLASVVMLSGIGLILLTPMILSWCLTVWGWLLGALYVRQWSRWVWLGSGLAVLVVLVVIRSRSQP